MSAEEVNFQAPLERSVTFLAGAGAIALSVASSVEPLLIVASEIYKVCVKVAEALQKVKKNSKGAEALQVRVTSIANIVSSKLSAKHTTDVEMNTMNALFKTLNETNEWVERRIEKEEKQSTLHQLWKASDTEEKIKSFDERLSKHMLDLNVAQSVALDFNNNEMKYLLQLLSQSQKDLAEQLMKSDTTLQWTMENAIEKLVGIEEHLLGIEISIENVNETVQSSRQELHELTTTTQQVMKDGFNTVFELIQQLTPSSPVQPLVSSPQSPPVLTNLIPWAELKGEGQEIGVGSFGIVRKYMYHGGEIALKELRGVNAWNSKQKEMLLSEAAIQANLQHPFVVRVYGIAHDETSGKYGIVQQLMGPGLDTYSRGLPIETRIKFICQIADGMNYMHSKNPAIIHGDIKPHNILISESGISIGLTDFGLSRTKAQLGRTTSAGGLRGAGTEPFKAPELFEMDEDGEYKYKSSKATDVYAFGITSFCILTDNVNGPYPEEDENGDEFRIKRAVKAGKRPSDYTQWPSTVPDWLKILIIRCWSQEEVNRPTMSEVIGMTEMKEMNVSTESNLQENSNTNLPSDALSLVKLLQSESVKSDPIEIAKVAEALKKITKSDLDRNACIFAGAPTVLTALAKETIVKQNSNASQFIAWAIANIALNASGNQACITAGAPSALIVLSREKAVKENGLTARYVAEAIWAIVENSEAGKQACILSGAPFALTALARERAVKENSDATKYVAWAIASIAESVTGNAACIDAGCVSCLTSLTREKAVKENSEAARRVAWAIANIAKTDAGIKACMDAGTPFALIDLSREKKVKESGDAAKNVAFALGNISENQAGNIVCINAGAPLALADLARETAVKNNSEAAHTIALAIWALADIPAGKQACIAAGIPFAFTSWASENSVKESSDAASCIAGALDVLSEIPAGLQACIAAGAPSALIDLGRETVNINNKASIRIASALTRFASIDGGLQACIDADAPSVLVGFMRENSVKKDVEAVKQIAEALDKIASKITGKELCIKAHASSALSILAREKVIKDDITATRIITGAIKTITGKELQVIHLTEDAEMLVRQLKSITDLSLIKKFAQELEKIASVTNFYIRGSQVCIDAGAPSALIILAREKTVKENPETEKCVASAYRAITRNDLKTALQTEDVSEIVKTMRLERVKSNASEIVRICGHLWTIAETDEGSQICIDAGAPFALTALAREEVSKENSDTAQTILAAIWRIAKISPGKEAFIVAGAPFALTDLACSEAVKKSSNAAWNVAGAIRAIIINLSGVHFVGIHSVGLQACIVSGAPSTLTNLARENSVKQNFGAARAVAEALKHFASTAEGKQACIDANASSVLISLARENVIKKNTDATKSVAEAFKAISSDDLAESIMEEDIRELVKQASSERVKLYAPETRRIAEEIEKISKIYDSERKAGKFAFKRPFIDAGAPSALIILAREKTVKQHPETEKCVASAYRAITGNDLKTALQTEDVSEIVKSMRLEKVKSNASEIIQVCENLWTIAKTDEGSQICIDAGVYYSLTQLLREKVTKIDSNSALWVSAVILTIAANDEGRKACIKAGSHFALTELASERSVTENGEAAMTVVGALITLARSEIGKKSCIDANASIVLKELAREKDVRENSEAIRRIIKAIKAITGEDINLPIASSIASKPMYFNPFNPVLFRRVEETSFYNEDEVGNLRLNFGLSSLNISPEENRWEMKSTIATVSSPLVRSNENLVSDSLNHTRRNGGFVNGLLSISINNKVTGGKLGAKFEEVKKPFSNIRLKSISEEGLFFANGVRTGLFIVNVDGIDVSKLSYEDAWSKVLAANKKMNEGETISFIFTDSPDVDPNPFSYLVGGRGGGGGSGNASAILAPPFGANVFGVPSSNLPVFSTATPLASSSSSSSVPTTSTAAAIATSATPIRAQMTSPSLPTSVNVQQPTTNLSVSQLQAEMLSAVQAIVDLPLPTSGSTSSTATPSVAQYETQMCSRCGRTSHTVSSCYASYHERGYRLYY
jgi:serine/threonine protein kinase